MYKKIRYIDQMNYGQTNVNDDILKVFNTSSSSSIDPLQRAINHSKNNLLDIIALYLALDDIQRKSINDYFNIPPKIRDIIEIKIRYPGHNHTEIAKELGISRRTLYNRMDELKEEPKYKDILAFIQNHSEHSEHSESNKNISIDINENEEDIDDDINEETLED